MMETLKAFTILPLDFLILTATALPIIEIGIGILLILKIRQRQVLFFASFLFLVFMLFSVYGTILDIRSDCGCFGSFIQSEIGFGMIVRNTLILLCSSVLYKSNEVFN